jgi:hypothetical protein
MSELQKDTIDAVHEESKGHLPTHDVGRRDSREERVGSGGTSQKKR